MKAMDTLRMALGFADQGVRALETMKDAPLVPPGSFGGNHGMWILGHVTVAEGRLHKILFDSFDEVLRTYRRLRSRAIAFLDEIGDEGLDRPTKVAPPGLEAAFATVGQAVMTVAMHQTFHNGEAAVARRAAGQRPVFTPSKERREF